MPTVIDSLIVRLELDNKEFTGKSASADKTLKDIKVNAKSASDSVDRLARSVGSFLAILGGTVAIRKFVEDTIASSAALDRLSKNLGVSVSDLSAWGNAVEELGGSAKGLQGSLDMLSRSQTELRLTGQSALIPYFSALGVSLATVGGQARPVDQILLDLADRFSRMDRTTANNMGRMMGLDQDTLNLLLQGRREVELTIKRQKEYNAVNKAQAEESAKLQKALVGVRQGFVALGRDLLQQASPAIEKMLNILSSLVSWAQNNREFIKDLGVVLGVIAAGLTAISIASSPITLTVAAVVALAAAVALLWQDYQTWKRGGDTLIDWSKWEPGILAAELGIKNLAKIAKESFGAIFDSVNAVTKLLHGDWKGALDSGRKSDSKVRQILKDAWADAHQEVGTLYDPASKLRYQPGAVSRAIAQAEGFNAKGSVPNRPQRNHNPGDIEYGDFAKAHGATGSDGRFAIFPDDATGYKALDALLATKSYAGLTVAQAIAKYAPSNENDTKGYTASVLKQTGGSPTSTVAMLNSVGGASGGAVSHSDNRVNVQTGPVTIQTQATDANGIARDWVQSMNYQFAAQANSGLF